MLFFSNHSLPAEIAYAIFPLSHLSTEVFGLSFWNVPFPKKEFTALLPHCSLPAGIAKIIPRLPYIYVGKISDFFFLFIAPAFLRKEMANEGMFLDSGITVFFSKYFQAEGIAYAIPPLPHLSAKVCTRAFCNVPFPKDDFIALLPPCSLPAGNSEITPRLPYISAEKIKCPFLIAAAPAFLRIEKANEEVPKDSGVMLFFSNHSLPAGIAYAIFPLPHLSAKVLIHFCCSAPFPKDDFTALRPPWFLPAGNSEITPRLPYIYVGKISGVFCLFIAPSFCRKEVVNEKVFKDGDFTVFFSNHSRTAGIAYAIPPLPHLSAKVFIISFCSAPFPKNYFTALFPHWFLPAENAEIIPSLPYIYVVKNNRFSLRHAALLFLRREKTNE
jgi:hypothetical protein